MQPPLRAPNSSSKLQQRFLCPGSAHAEKGYERTESPESKEGTLLHWHDANPAEPRDKLTDEQRETLTRNAALRTRFLDSQRTQYGITPTTPCRQLVEQEFYLCDFDGVPIISHDQLVPGHPDLVLYYPTLKLAIVFDSKFGRIEVPAAWVNLQLRSYAVELSDNFECNTIVVAITQPWAKHPNDFHAAEYSANQIPEFRAELIKIVRDTEPLDAPRNASIEACRHCDAAGECPVSISEMTDLAVTNVQNMTPAELESIAPDIALAKRVIEQWEHRMKVIAKTMPTMLKEHVLGSESSAREITDPVKAFELLIDVGLITHEGANVEELIFSQSVHDFLAQKPGSFLQALVIYLNCCKPSIGQLEQAIARNQGKSKEAAGNLMSNALGSIIGLNPREQRLIRKTKSLHEGKPQ